MKLPLLRLYLLLAWGGIVFFSITAFMPQVTEITSRDTSAYLFDNPFLPIQQPNEMPAATDPMSITVQCIDADLAITKTAASTYTGGNLLITYTITVTNKGPDLATGVQVTDRLPASLVYGGLTSSQGTYSNVTGIWDVGELAKDDLATLVITTTLNSCTDTPQFISNTAYVTADQIDPNVPNFAQVDIKADYLCSIDLVVSDTVITQTIGSGLNKQMLITYTITVTNDGPGTANSVILTDTISTDLMFGGYTTSEGEFSFDNSTGIGVWDNYALNGHMTATLMITATMGPCKGGREIPNMAVVAVIGQTESITDNNEARVGFVGGTGYCIYLPVLFSKYEPCIFYDFSFEEGDWVNKENDDRKYGYTTNGEYQMIAKNSSQTHLAWPKGKYENFVISSTVKWANESSKGKNYGLTFDITNLGDVIYSFKTFMVYPNSRETNFEIKSYNRARTPKWTTLSSGYSANISSDINFLLVERLNGTITITANNTFLDKVDVPQSGKKHVGIGVGPYDKIEPFNAEARYENYRICPLESKAENLDAEELQSVQGGGVPEG